MPFVRSAAGWFGAKKQGRAGAGRHSQLKRPSGKSTPPLKYQIRFTGCLGSSRGNGALPATQRTTGFPVDHTSQQLCHPRRGRVPRENLGTLSRAGGRLRFSARWIRPRVEETHAQVWVLPVGLWPGPLLGA